MDSSPAPFLNGTGGRTARSSPQLEDEASATDLHEHKKVKKNKQGLDLGETGREMGK
jgi:hypothetical protein